MVLRKKFKNENLLSVHVEFVRLWVTKWVIFCERHKCMISNSKFIWEMIVIRSFFEGVLITPQGLIFSNELF